MNGASREAFAAARERIGTLLGTASTDAARLGADLAAVVTLLDGEAGLRRALTDPSRPADAKAGLAAALLDGQLDSGAVDLVAGMVRSRWSAPRDLADSIEKLSVVAELTDAERRGSLDAVEDELFRFGRIVAGNSELRAALTSRIDTAAGREARGELVRGLLGGRADAVTMRLVERLVRAPRGRSLEAGLEAASRDAADLRSRIVAVVTAALPLNQEQKDRLGAALTRLYGRQVHLNIDIDAEVLGGLRIEIGDEVIDGTVAGRLTAARQHFEG
ncbi:F0F1 ATP synthase subunit delta [Mangrovactinospora gilvigrisea]|uniref:ATP synthase subunit delta n=1 Tax=Mangrovactinospora gilvigrisea TaxID=1428644 RepID=A0A1J7BDR1_9ACTN|nr:F0F1 ATP synthase subunit delta [Mangrovactinospora gilvigrisea]OIV36815.1 F0F1 ATP synthase subunit delta [Mangrovactinospora gilvigrisea]